MSFRLAIPVAATIIFTALPASFSTTSKASAAHTAAGHVATAITPNGTWTVYHRDAAHTGSDATAPTAVTASAGWVSPTLDETIYGQPLVYGGIIYVGTSNNTVYALNQTDGSIIWSQNVGAPQTTGWQCGNINPTGILGTGVIDVAHSRVYYVAFLTQFHSYYLYGFDLASGSIVQVSQILPVGFDWTDQQQRGALALSSDGTHVYVPFGGRDGDCGTYWGWVIGVPTAGGLPNEQYRTPSTAESVWAAGGVLVDNSTGNVFFATGNAIPCSGAVNSDSVIRTASTLGPATSFFQPSDWEANWCGPDLDLGSASPVLISPSLMFTSGKFGSGFLLNPANLGGTGGELFRADVCHGINFDATFGAFAYAAPYVYLECNGGGLVALQVNTTTQTFSQCAASCVAPSWIAADGTTFGPPIVAGGVVWVVDINGGGLYGFDATTGAQRFHSAGFTVNHFSSPSEAGGQVFVSADNVVRSFKMFNGCTSVTATASPPSPAAVGTPVAITATASGCPNPSPLFEFWYRSASSACCTPGQSYSTSATFPWVTTSLTGGTYFIAVWVKDAGSSGAFGNSFGRYDAAFVLTFSLGANVCTGVHAAPAPTSPQVSGTPVTITATAVACPNPAYQFFVLYPGSQKWLLAQAYSVPGNVYSWTTQGKPAGTYNFSIWARDASSNGVAGNSLGTWDTYTTLQFTLTSIPCSSVAPASSPTGSASAGTPVTISGSAAGCPNPSYEFWILYPGSQTWLQAQAYSAPGNTFSWSTTGKPKGVYHFSIWARDASSTGVAGNALGTWDAYTAMTYTLT